jgi:hypothetical protein
MRTFSGPALSCRGAILNHFLKSLTLTGVSILAVACAGGAKPAAGPPLDLREGRKLVGTENGVRVDAEVLADHVVAGTAITIRYTLTNGRPGPIAVADMVAVTTYDPDTRVLTVNVGSEVPGQQTLPRLIQLSSGEKRDFTIGASTNFPAGGTRGAAVPHELRLKVNFLGNVQPFSMLVNIPEKVVVDPKLADELFAKWIEGTESVITNSLPVHWAPRGDDPTATDSPRAPRRRG